MKVLAQKGVSICAAIFAGQLALMRFPTGEKPLESGNDIRHGIWRCCINFDNYNP